MAYQNIQSVRLRPRKSEIVLRCAHAVACILHAASSIALWTTSSAQPITTLGVRVRWRSVDGITKCSDEQCFSDPYIAKFSTLSLLEICAAFGSITALSHAIQTIWILYTTRLSRGVFNPIRWAEYSVTASLMFVCIQLICGIYDESAIWTGAVTMWAIMASGGVTEYMYAIVPSKTNAILKTDIFRAPGAFAIFMIQVALYLFLWVTLFDTLADANRDKGSTNEMPEIVYIIVGIMFLVFSSFVAIFYWASIRGMKIWNKTLNVVNCEVLYITASLTAKLLLHWFLWSSVISQDEMLIRDDASSHQGPKDSDSIRNQTLIIGGIVLVIGALFATTTMCVLKKCKDD